MAAPAPVSAAPHIGIRLVPMHAGEPCGDAAARFDLPGPASSCLLAIVDGLGHGPEAAQAADLAMQTIAEQPGQPLAEILAGLDIRLTATRGAAIGLARIDGGLLSHAGIGNTRTVRWRGDHLARLPSQPGIVGGGLCGTVDINRLELLPGDWLLMFTDGLHERLQLPVRLPEWDRDPDTLCDHLLRRWRSAPDDAGVLVMRLDPR